MPDNFQWDVFLSHSHRDRPRVVRLAERLRECRMPATLGRLLYVDWRDDITLTKLNWSTGFIIAAKIAA